MTADDTEKQHRELLGEDLWELAQREPASLKRVIPLTTLPSKALSRASFRLEFAGGTTRKGRRLGSEEDAKRIETLCEFLDQQFFPRVLARCDTALLIEWIDGRPLSSGGVTPALAKHCGGIMGMLHSTALPEDLRTLYGCDVTGWRTRIRANIEDLSKRQALDGRTVRLALHVAETRPPVDATIGLIHGDFCVDNFIETASGRIAIIDNETLSIDVCAYDLARTWSRWPLDQQQTEAFYDGYHQYRTSEDFRKDHLYWTVAVLTEAAVFRLRAATVGADVLLERLRSTLESSGLDETT